MKRTTVLLLIGIFLLTLTKSADAVLLGSDVYDLSGWVTADNQTPITTANIYFICWPYTGYPHFNPDFLILADAATNTTGTWTSANGQPFTDAVPHFTDGIDGWYGLVIAFLRSLVWVPVG